jgi:hypothetical protein
VTAALAGWHTRDLATHLEELAEATERSVVTLHTTSGLRHTGYVVGLARGTVALQSLPQRGTPDLDITIIPVARVEAVTLHAAQTRKPVSPAPDLATSMLELRRRAKAQSDLLAARTGKPIPIAVGDGELTTLASLFEALRTALTEVCADELGRNSLAERVARIELRAGAPAVALDGGTLIVTGPMAADRVRSAIDGVL